MGYTTTFSGAISVEPPLNEAEIEYLNKFSESRRMDWEQGPYFVDGEDNCFKPDPKVRDYNRPPTGQPGLWCQWRPTGGGTLIEWDKGEKFYDATEWMTYLIDHFLKPGALATKELPFLQANHICNGTIKAQGEDMDDRWKLIVKNNVVTTRSLE